MQRTWLAAPILLAIVAWLLLPGAPEPVPVPVAPPAPSPFLPVSAGPPPIITGAAQVLPACTAWFQAVAGLEGMARPARGIEAAISQDDRILLRAGDAWVAVDAHGRMEPCRPDQARGLRAPRGEELGRAQVAAWRWQTLPDTLPDAGILSEAGGRAAVSARMYDWLVVLPADPSGTGAELTVDPWGAVHSADLMAAGDGHLCGSRCGGGRMRCLARGCGGPCAVSDPGSEHPAEPVISASN